MGTTIATKADLRLLEQKLTSEIRFVRKDMELISTTLTVRLGSMMIVGLSLLFAALRLT